MTHLTQKPSSMAQASSTLNHLTEEPKSTMLIPLIKAVALLVTLLAQQSVWANGIYTFFKSNDNSNRIFYSDSFNESSWYNGQTINNIDSTSSSLAAASFRGKTYTIWRANDNLASIYYSASDDGKYWPAGQKINNAFKTSAAPAAVAYGDKLYVFWKANDPSNSIFYSSSSDGESCSAVKRSMMLTALHLLWRRPFLTISST